MTSKAKIFDQYFTPPALAIKLIQAFTIPKPECVGDFAAGDGELLRAAEKRWPGIACIAVDIDEVVVSKLQSNHPTWQTRRCDFTDAAARKKLLFNRKKLLRKIPSIALNPPFSIQEGKVRVRSVTIANTAVRCSPALAFVVDALTYLGEGGQLVAIIPQGVINSALDAEARRLLQEHYGFEVVELIPPIGFKDCSPRTAIVRLTAGISLAAIEEPVELVEGDIISHLLRGSISNTRVENSDHPLSLPFIHTTDLFNGKLCGPKKRLFLSDVVYAAGPAVLIPRVGKPDVNKIVLLPTGMKAVLSDCVMAVECLTLRDAHELHRRLITQWSVLEQTYGGTCARYISVDTLAKFLQKSGCQLLSCLKELRKQLKKPKSIAKTTLAT
jgi:hypothetical protein